MNNDDKRVYPFPQNDKKENASAKICGGFFRNKRNLLIIALAVAICVIFTVAIIFIVKYFTNKSSINYNPEVTFAKYTTTFEEAEFVSLGDTFVVATEDSVTGFTHDGIWKWEYEGSFENIILTICGDYAVVAQTDNTAVLFFSEDGYEKRTSTDGKILFANSQDNMLLVGFIYDNYEYGLSLFDVNKSEMCKFTRKYSSIYLISAVMSEKNSFICVSGVDKDSTGATSVVKFVKEKDGEEYSTITEDEILYPLITAVGDTVFIANSDRLKLVKRMPSATETSDKENVIWERNGSAEFIISIATSSNTVATVRKSEMSSNSDSILEIYNTSGKLIKALHTNMDVNGIINTDKGYVIFNDDTLALYTTEGKCIGYYEEAALIKSICNISGNKIAIMTDSGITTIDFDKKGEKK